MIVLYDKELLASQLTGNSESPAPFLLTKNKERKSGILTLALCGSKDWLLALTETVGVDLGEY
jgi:hypothetical protein